MQAQKSIEEKRSNINQNQNQGRMLVLDYNESPNSSHNLKRDEVDWTQSRIIFISPEFTKYQQHAIGFKGIQLWEVHKYNNGLLVFNEVKSPLTKESITEMESITEIAKRTYHSHK